MRNIQLLRSAKDLTIKWIESHHVDKNDPDYQVYLEAFKPEVVRLLVEQEVARQNAHYAHYDD